MGRKLLVYMIDGTEYGPRTVEIGNWVGKAVYSNRGSVPKIFARDEVKRPGVYILKSSPVHSSFTERIYIGEAEKIESRLKQQLVDPKRDFEELVFFISKDNLLTKAHVKYLECRLLQDAYLAKAAEIDNENMPTLPMLHEAEVSDLEYFLEQMKLVLPIMGFKFLISSSIKETKQPEIISEIPMEIFYIKSNRIKATMYQSEKGFVVTKGSQAKKNMGEGVSESYTLLRQKLIETGLLVLNGNLFLFADDTIFSSPSAAANVVLGRQTPGPITWVNIDGKTLKARLEENSF